MSEVKALVTTSECSYKRDEGSFGQENQNVKGSI